MLPHMLLTPFPPFPPHTHIACLTGCSASVVIVAGKLKYTNFKRSLYDVRAKFREHVTGFKHYYRKQTETDRQTGRQGYVSPLILIFAYELGKVYTYMATHHGAV
jgi:hypothetical protein